MQVFNTLSRKKEEFLPMNPPDVTFYICGPTVYDFFHIGNGRSFTMADILRRYLTYKGYNVKFVMNITDIDDKIISRASEQNTDIRTLSQTYVDYFLEDLKKLGIEKANVNPRATEHMKEIISLIKDLVDKKFAYSVDGDVFFDVGKFKGYGKLSGKKIDELESGARVEVNEKKINPLDFVLWKNAKPGEPYWESPWGNGRPGWHIECSAMSMAHLGETIDIHAGGTDLIFPHHENEIAQSEASTGKPFVKYWLHLGFLNIRDEKMSKSLGNFSTARDVLKKFSKGAIRLFFLQTHYRGLLNFTDELLTAAEKGLEKISNFVEQLNERIESKKDGPIPDFQIDEYRRNFEEAMDDDFNTPRALAVLFDFIRDLNKVFADHPTLSQDFLGQVKSFLDSTASDVFNIIEEDGESKSGNMDLIDNLINLLIKFREDARQNKNFEMADKIRNELELLGITLKDSKDGTTYKIN